MAGANPFLMMDQEFSSAPPPTSNPFLMDSAGFPEAGDMPMSDNPFFGFTSEAPPVTNGTNPFAFDFGGPPAVTTAPTTNVDTFFSVSNEPNNIFGNVNEVQPTQHTQINQQNIVNDLMSGETNDMLGNDMLMGDPTPAIQKPDVLHLDQVNSVKKAEDAAHAYSSDEEMARMMPKRPPPPARPVVPPSKETQDLLMSVMGAMDATSSHLLDRIPPTRTPSPVSMRDLHSPSPTPDNVFVDLMDVDNSAKPQPTTNAAADINLLDVNEPEQTQPISEVTNQQAIHSQPQAVFTQPQPVFSQPQPVQTQPMHPVNNQSVFNQPINNQPINNADPFMSLMSENAECDINQNHNVQQAKQAPPSRPVPPRPVPPRPSPPQKPPPPAMNKASTPEMTAPPRPMVPPQPANHSPVSPQPAEPVPVSKPFSPPKQNNFAMDDDNFMLGEQEKPAEKHSTTADIMNLYSAQQAPKAEPMDLLCDNGQTVQSTNISREQSQQDLHMDTSDTQSKGSASSATLNPFTSEETIVPAMLDTSPVKSTEVLPESNNVFTQPEPVPTSVPEQSYDAFGQSNDEFDAFAAKFDSAVSGNGKGSADPFASGSAWGDVQDSAADFSNGFDADEPFDAFLSMQAPPAVPQGTPAMLSKRESQESDEDKDFSVVIRPKNDDGFGFDTSLPVLAPPPKVEDIGFNDTSPRFNPFDQRGQMAGAVPDQLGALPFEAGEQKFKRTDSQETPETPLYDEDTSQPLEDFPRITYTGDGWEMQLRQPNKKKITGQRFWKKIFVKLVYQEGMPILQLSNQPTDKDPFQELPLQPCYSVSEIGAQQYDTYGKIFTIKLQYVFYKERPGVRPGQVTKAERITNKLSQFAAYAIQGDYQGVKEFGSDLKKLGLPVEHAPQVSQLLKLGSLNYEDLKQFSVCIEEALFRLSAHRDRALHYKMEEVQITAVDELYVEQNAEGHVEKQIARVRLFFLGFLSGMPDIELGVNDMRRQGKEVVGRHDIIPVVTEEWIRFEKEEFHACVQQEDYETGHTIKFKPPDACYIELMRFRIRPPKNRELPLQLKPSWCVTGNKVVLKADVLVPGFASRKLGQVPCEDVMIRFPIPECWIYLFRVEKHFRYGSVKSAHRRTGKVKGIERILGAMETLQESLIEVTSGQAKYEHQHRSIVWRIPRLPKEGQGAYTTHHLVVRMSLTSYDQIPEQLAEYAYVEFTMPATQVSHTTVRSVSLQNSQSDDPPEKYVRYLARHEYRVGIEQSEGDEPAAYSVAAAVNRPAPVQEEPHAQAAVAESSSDSD